MERPNTRPDHALDRSHFLFRQWTYYATDSSARIRLLVYKHGVTTRDVDCRPPGWYISQGTFSPGICPYRWATVKVEMLPNSLTSIQCCPTGYSILAQDLSATGSNLTQCVSAFTTTGVNVLVYKAPPFTTHADLSEVSGQLTYLFSPVHVLHAETDLSILPTEKAGDTPAPTGPAAGNVAGEAGADLNSGAIAGIVIGAVLCVILVVLGALFVWKRKGAERRARQEIGYDGRAEMSADGAEAKPFEAGVKEKSPADINAVRSPVEMFADAEPPLPARSPIELP
ncbi:hypothetical protein QBC34DRAFT_55517 [Podospora aff. communis PSN243]|uniref:Mid2 domain-containing protein n=1 Tax=Podospora aff. communis PSN243 TaxID=3040156 RepID=A0AAV9GT71_9PEZI|nr:hypothetical protein QBC34DRAFT_55517 [Podospora aff. communis PSN243]